MYRLFLKGQLSNVLILRRLWDCYKSTFEIINNARMFKKLLFSSTPNLKCENAQARYTSRDRTRSRSRTKPTLLRLTPRTRT